MNIRAKLILLVLGTVILIGLACGFYFFMLGRVDRLDREKTSFAVLADAMKDERIQLNRLPGGPIAERKAAFLESSERLWAAYDGLGSLVYIPRLSLELKSMVTIIRMLQALEKRHESELIAAEGADATVVNSKVDALDSDLDSSIKAIAKQYVRVNDVIAKERNKAIIASILIILAVALGTLTAAILLASGIASAIIAISRNIAHVKEGDLTARSRIVRKDEIGALSSDFDLFLDYLVASIRGVKESSKASIAVKGRLATAVGEGSVSASRIEERALSIRSQVGTLDRSVERSTVSVGTISRSIADLNAQIEDQARRVEESTASVTQILGSLVNMSRITERDKEAVEKLVEESEGGRRIFQEAFERIGEIPKSIGAIREMAEIIRSIASQTDLLAMNAAIEAAHAGDYGKGFSVVSDEIRKLSEASKESSSEIAKSIETIFGNINEAMNANEGTTEVFSAIEGRIKEVSRSVVELYSSIGEIETGGTQILRAMTELRELSERIRDGSVSMEADSSEISSMMEELNRISGEVTNDIGGISEGIAGIGLSIRTVADLSDLVGAEGDRLDAEVNRFRTNG